MSMLDDVLTRVRKLEKQVEALLERHPEVRSVLERGTVAMKPPETYTSTSVLTLNPDDCRVPVITTSKTNAP